MRKRHPSQTARGRRSGTLEFIQSLFAASPDTPRRFRPRVERLEERHMMSVTPLVANVTGLVSSITSSTDATAADASSSTATSALTLGTLSDALASALGIASANNSSSSGGSTSSRTGSSGNQGTLAAEPINGVGNNIANPTWGAAGSDFTRIAASNFADGISTPNGQTLPSARVISNLTSDQDIAGLEQDMGNSRNMSDFVYAWGQFIDHDIDLTESGSVAMDIPIPTGDPTFDSTSQGGLQIAFNRSQIAPGTGVSTPAQFVNQDTSFIDGSTIYGSDAATAAALRTFKGGQLLTSAGNLLPYNTMGLNMADNIGVPETTLFAAGDVRANENVELSNLTTLFVREHNTQAALLAKQHPNWTDQQLYDGARQIVIGEIQSITYNEWLPALMGTGALTTYQGYNSTVNPSVTDEFASAAFRLHTLLDDDVQFLNNNGAPITSIMGGDLPLDEDFFQPAIVAMPGEVAANLKYLASDNAQEVDEQTVDGLRNALFPDAPVMNGVEVGASDLIADDIQRGRDEGDPTYNQMRVAMGEKPVTSFAQITSNVQLQAELKQIYGNVNNVELFVGLMGEDHLPGSSLGQTEQAILATQFEALRDGDRYFYENADSKSLVNQLNNTTLADVIERNTNLTNLQSNVFYFTAGTISGTVTSANGNLLAGVAIQLINANGRVLQTTVSASDGTYEFTDLNAGKNYVVRIQIPAQRGPDISLLKIVHLANSDNAGDYGIDFSLPRSQSSPVHNPVSWNLLASLFGAIAQLGR